MKVCVAQTKPVTGKILQNIESHKVFVEKAAAKGADIIIFPELSLTGYEPDLAKRLAVDAQDIRLDVFQQISDRKQIIIGVGVPTVCEKGICISMILFQPGKERSVYSKKYLHADEEPFFIPGDNIVYIKIQKSKVAFAICYEISIPQHADAAFKNKPDVYIASVAKFFTGIDKAINRLSEIARTYSTPVLMSNCIGISDGQQCAGKTSVWNGEEVLLDQLEVLDEGILIFDTDTHEVYKSYFQYNSERNDQLIS